MPHTNQLTTTQVLIVGAGPTGLTLACELARRNIRFRIIDAAPRHPIGSRGKALQPRSLEVFEDLSVIDQNPFRRPIPLAVSCLQRHGRAPGMGLARRQSPHASGALRQHADHCAMAG